MIEYKKIFLFLIFLAVALGAPARQDVTKCGRRSSGGYSGTIVRGKKIESEKR